MKKNIFTEVLSPSKFNSFPLTSPRFNSKKFLTFEKLPPIICLEDKPSSLSLSDLKESSIKETSYNQNKDAFERNIHRRLGLNNLKLMTMGSKNIKNLIKFVIFKIMIPLFSFAGFCGLLVFIQIVIGDYCFYPKVCECGNIFVFFYSIFKEILHTHSAMIIMFYYGTAFVTEDFYKKIWLKMIYMGICLIIFMVIFFSYYDRRNDQIFELLTNINEFSLFGINLILVLSFGFLLKKYSKNFFKKLFLALLLQIYLFFHRFYFKTYVMSYVLRFFIETFDEKLRLNLFKLFMMLYYIIYEFLSKLFIFEFFKETLKSNNLSHNIVIFALKFVSIDVLSTKALNILTIPLNDIFSWICFFFYIYSIFSTYSRTNVLRFAMKKLFNYFLKIPKKDKKNSEEMIKFEDLRSGCIFETNLIVFLRIISFRILNNFVIFTNDIHLYENCTLKEKSGFFVLLDNNLILLMTAHTILLIIMGVFIYGFNVKSILFNYQIEEISVIGRLILFIICFSYADYTLQMFKNFDEYNLF